MSGLPLQRTRLAVALVSATAVALQLVLMRVLALQFWGHLAALVIGVALLGYGTSGTALTLLRTKVQTDRRRWLGSVILLLGLCILLAPRAARLVSVNVQFLAWDPAQAGGVLVLELVYMLPFVLAGAAVGIVLMEDPERLAGHYAATLFGSGLGALGAVLAMEAVPTSGLPTVLVAVTLIAAALIIPPGWRGLGGLAATLAAAGLLTAGWPWRPVVSEFKALPQFMDMPESEILERVEGPLGRLDVVAGPAVRHAPGLGLGFVEEIPPHAVILLDGDAASAVYACADRNAWRFMDHTTGAAVYHLWRPLPPVPSGRTDCVSAPSAATPEVLVIGAGGGSEIGLAQHHGARAIVALEMNRQLIALLTGPLRDRGGGIYLADNVTVLPTEARGYLARTERTFDIIQLPALDAFGATGAGLHAAQESYLYTIEAFGEMFDRLSAGGYLSLTRWARTPPRDELKALAMAAETLRQRSREPRDHLAMIRNWATVTVLVSEQPFTPAAAGALREFCADRGFDLCLLPGLARQEANRFHVLDQPLYYDAAQALLGADRVVFSERYLFDITPASDDRPYFFRSLRWTSLREFWRQFGSHGRAHLDLGSWLAAAALLQGVAVGAVLILLPLVPRRRGLRGIRRRGPVLVYFLMLGAGFMLLEIGFLQKLILYLSHPIYAAATVIAAFLVASGLGSLASGRRTAPHTAIARSALIVACLGLVMMWSLDGWLKLTRGSPLPVRVLLASATIAPLAFFMGQLMPAGLALLGRERPALVPWAWAVNGFASVSATVAVPLIAAEAGFKTVLLAAVACYLLAGWSGRRLPPPA